jgi:hypothetical protein
MKIFHSHRVNTRWQIKELCFSFLLQQCLVIVVVVKENDREAFFGDLMSFLGLKSILKFIRKIKI